jgi:hypothetical protein
LPVIPPNSRFSRSRNSAAGSPSWKLFDVLSSVGALLLLNGSSNAISFYLYEMKRSNALEIEKK